MRFPKRQIGIIVLLVAGILGALYMAGSDVSDLTVADIPPMEVKRTPGRMQTVLPGLVETRFTDWLQTMEIISSADGSIQPVRFYVPESVTPDQTVPLIIVLHSWSEDFKAPSFIGPVLGEAEKRGWLVVQPNYRGPNNAPEAGASPLAVADVIDAADHMIRRHHADPARVYVVGVGGGGQMALMLAARHPDRWAGVSAWAPISDLAAWYAQLEEIHPKIARDYQADLRAICGGNPSYRSGMLEYMRRSPVHFLASAAGVPMDINAGLSDGHSGPVPVSQAIRAFNVLARANGMPDAVVDDDSIAFMVTHKKVPPALEQPRMREKKRRYPVRFRRTAGPARLTLTMAGHDGNMIAAVDWLARQRGSGAHP
jgi:pimeloyl-ACP methyl ester carboxylesterase